MQRIALTCITALLLIGCPSGSGGGTGGGTGGGSGGGTGGGSGGGSTLAPVQFRYPTHAMSFENYGNVTPTFTATNLTDVEMLRLFGDGVCTEPSDGGVCTLTPSALTWMNAQNAAMNGGHCEGMAVLAMLFATGQADPNAFGADSGFALTIANNVPLQREIAYWWATQSTQPTQAADSRGKLTANELVALLENSFANGGESYTFGLYKRDGTGGHANTPYAVRTVDAGLKEVLVYENNFPNDVKFVSIDTVANSWSYLATPNPMTAAELYDGPAGDKQGLTLTATSARLKKQICAVCGAVNANGMGTKGSLVSYRELHLEGAAHVTVSDGQNHSIYLDGGSYVNTIPGATITANRVGPSTWTAAMDPVFQLPANVPLTVKLDGTKLTAATRSNVRLTAPGYAFSVGGVNVDPGQVDTLTFAAGSDRVTYATTGPETPTVQLGLSLDGNDYLFEITAGAETSGVTVELRVEVPAARLAVKITSADGAATYAVKVHVLARGDTVFAHTGNAISTMDTIYLKYGSWAGDGQAMAFDVDTNSDGSIDQTLMVTDDGN